jgi:superfamily II DNA or RNA helicase
VRTACSPAAWSRGVELARAGAVSDEGHEDDARLLRVRTRGGLVSPLVRLFPDDPDWDCECGTAEGCEHLAAATLALAQGRVVGQEESSGGRVGYRFRRSAQGLVLTRVVRTAGGEEALLTAPLAALAAGRVDAPAVTATAADRAVERALGGHRDGPLPRGLVAGLLGALTGAADVTLDGEPVTTATEPVLPVVAVEEAGERILLRLEPPGGLEQVFARQGVALVGGTLRPIGEPALTAREREELPRGRAFAPAELAALVADVLPGLAGRVPVDVRTARLPGVARMPPRARVVTRGDGDALRVRAEIVYGDPPTARVEEDRLVPLGSPLPLRDREAERAAAHRLEAGLGLAPGVEVTLRDEEAVAWAERLAAWAGDVAGTAHRRFRRAPALVPELLAGEGFGLGFRSGGRGAGLVGPEEVVRAWEEGRTLVALPGGEGFAPLPAEWLERHGHLVADLTGALDPAAGARAPLPGWAVPDAVRLCAALDAPIPNDLARLAARLEPAAPAPAATLPEQLAARLRPYQRMGAEWLTRLGDAGLGALLADDMGLGKTVQALCALRGRSLVVAPTSVLGTWRDELARFRPELRLSIYHGPGRRLDAAADVTLTSYALLRGDVETLAAEGWETVVLDEAQAIKNPDSQVAQAALALPARRRIALTGTPIENRLEELWSQMRFLNPGLLGRRADFAARTARPVAAGDAAALERLRRRLRPFVLRRLKRDVAPELPPRTETVLHCVLDERERALYDAVRAATRREVLERLEAGGAVLGALEALLRLRQAACHPALLPGQQGETSAKLELLVDRLVQARDDDHKALVFSQWTALLDLVEPHLRAGGLDFVRLDGSTVDRAGVVARFQDAEDGPPVMLISLRAGGTGLTLTAADHVFLLDPWWNPAVEDQAADRAHRIGQDRPVFVHRLVAEDTVEERILALQERKRALGEATFAGAAGAAGLTRDDLLELLA